MYKVLLKSVLVFTGRVRRAFNEDWRKDQSSFGGRTDKGEKVSKRASPLLVSVQDRMWNWMCL